MINFFLKTFLTLLFTGIVLSVSFSQEIDPDYKDMIERKYDFPTISQDSTQKVLNNENFIILDTREKEEYNVSHLPNAIYIGYDDPKWKVVDSLDKSKTVIVYCSIGQRSQNIGKTLEKKGFTEVYNLYGGIFLWADQGRPLETPTDEDTDKVHGYNRFWGRWVQKAETVYE